MKLEDFTKTEIIAAIRSARSCNSQLEPGLLRVMKKNRIDKAEKNGKRQLKNSKKRTVLLQKRMKSCCTFTAADLCGCAQPKKWTS